MTVWRGVKPQAAKSPQPTLFLDRDGVLIRDRNYLSDPDEVELLPGVVSALIQARRAGFKLVGISNQSGLGRGYFSEQEFGDVMNRLVADLKAGGAWLDGFYYCPHAPADNCTCRKPRLGLLEEAALALAWEPALSWVIGDKSSDVGLGLGAGLGAVLVRTGYGRDQEAVVQQQWPHEPRLLVADDLAAAVVTILGRPEFSGREADQ